MLDAARLIGRYIQGRDFAAFAKDPMVQDAVIHRIEILAEASRHLSDGTKAALNEVPFVEIRGMRNRILHNYEDTAVDVVWHVAAR